MKSTDWRKVMGKYVSIKKYIIFIIFGAILEIIVFFVMFLQKKKKLGMVVHKKQYRWKIENPEG